MVWVT